MSDCNEYLTKIKEACSLHHAKPIAFLWNPNADGEYDKEFVLICKYDKGYDEFKSELSSYFYQIEENHSSRVDVNDVQFIKRLGDGIARHENQGYQLVWRDDSYIDPKRYESSLTRDGISFSMSVKKRYTLIVSYEEVMRKCSNRSDGYLYSHDFLRELLEDNSDFPDECIGRFAMKDVHLTEKGVAFIVDVKEKSGYTFDVEKDETDSELVEKLVRGFEDTTGHSCSGFNGKRYSCLLSGLRAAIKKAGDIPDEEDKDRFRICGSEFCLARPRLHLS